MPFGVWETTDVPANKVKKVEAGYKLDNPIKVESFEQPDKLWTVRATFPPDPANPGAKTSQPFDG